MEGMYRDAVEALNEELAIMRLGADTIQKIGAKLKNIGSIHPDLRPFLAELRKSLKENVIAKFKEMAKPMHDAVSKAVDFYKKLDGYYPPSPE